MERGDEGWGSLFGRLDKTKIETALLLFLCLHPTKNKAIKTQAVKRTHLDLSMKCGSATIQDHHL